MKNRDRLLVIMSWLFCAAAVFCAAVVAVVLLVPPVSIRLRYFLACVTGAFVFPTAAAISRSYTDVNENARKKLVHGSVIFIFAFYVLVFFAVLLFTKVFANNTGFVLQYNKYWLSDALPRLIPFSSIISSFKGFALGKISTFTLSLNIFGNLLLYTPLAFFVPAIFKSMRNYDSFLPFIVFLVIAVELAQGMFGLGSFETDDMILGICGALVAFSILNYGVVGDYLKENGFYF